MTKPIWKPSSKRIEKSNMMAFQRKANIHFDDYQDFHRWSIDNRDQFWTEILNQYEVICTGNKTPACTDTSFDTYSWFSNLELNFAENLLRKSQSSRVALNFIHESGLKQEYTYQDLEGATSQLQAGLSEYIGRGDVVACYMPNIPETVIAMLATSSLGGVFTSTSSDFGIEGVVDRFGQSKPKVLIASSSYEYNGKVYDQLEKIKEIEKRLPFLEKIVIVDFLQKEDSPDLSGLDKGILWEHFIAESFAFNFEKVPFDHPLYIMYSSGTTGKPKCIVHSVGGTLLQHIKELSLHSNLTEEKNIFYFTTCGWMMWNWLVSSLYFGSTITLYEGSPAKPSLKGFFEIIEKEKIHIFGTSPKFLKALEDSDYDKDFSLESLESILSTGAPLLPEQFDFVYQKIKTDICLSSISGGTDIIGCFMLGNPTLPVYPGQIQCIGLGMDVACYSEEGLELKGREGELVCRSSFPSRPIYFLDDPGNSRLKAAYFNHFPGVWYHGDFIQVTSEGGVLIFGRSDATLNPGGVRIGTAEIYRQTEQISWIEDSVCIGRKVDGDVEVVLFVKMKKNEVLNDERISLIKKTIKANTTPRHIPAHIWSIANIPYTRSGKKMELAITRILAKKEVVNIEAVANPECLAEYRKFSL